MLQYSSLDEVQIQNAWVTIGSFDGVHRGHQEILRRLVRDAHSAGDPAVVVTFFPNPVRVLRGLQDPYYLSSPEERAGLLADLGVDGLISLTFDRTLAEQSAEAFLRQLKQQVGLRCLWVGDDFALGRGRQGDLTALRRLGEQMDFCLEVMPEVLIDGQRVSSRRIRRLVSQGSMEEAAFLLGRPYTVSGPVVTGNQRGRTLGFPTANVEVWAERILPPNGVYATRVLIEGSEYQSVTNIGRRPTFESGPVAPRVEAHLFQYSGNLYGKMARVEFLQFIRPERPFASAQELVEQIQKDIQQTHEVFVHAR